jgi:hypothetical protein
MGAAEGQVLMRLPAFKLLMIMWQMVCMDVLTEEDRSQHAGVGTSHFQIVIEHLGR